ncbi:hypothetical protein HELRODRAFT_175940 [Helobdella robusta]|uniref:Uncharacterized protein n=1 Tax=Helobdella robusta TaxID=6412 RepID=T1F9Y0_HELRO|nr:hypothetical protein HELRODRAFT_175940 [Helobdella robusta]ESO00502.1 hypothetical protein HELRODRAFT_175940 [Helobdella robusta]
MIYDYFALNYGTIKPQTINNKSSNKSIEELKNKLKQLKLLGRSNQSFDNLIRSRSKELRAKFLSTKYQNLMIIRKNANYQTGLNNYKNHQHPATQALHHTMKYLQ